MSKNEKAEKRQPQTFMEHVNSWIRTIIGAIIIVMFVNGALIASFVVPTGSMENTVMTGDFLFVDKFSYGPSTPQIVPFFNIPLPFYKFPGIANPERGDVIVFIFPGNQNEVEHPDFTYYLKRCVAVSGDTLQIRNKVIYVNGQEFTFPEHGKMANRIAFESSATFPPGSGYSADNYGPLRIPKAGDVVELNEYNFREWNIFIQREGHKTALKEGVVYIDGKPATQYVVERDYCFGIGDNRDNSLDSRFWGFIPVENVVGTPLMVYWSWDSNQPSLIDKLMTIRFGRIGNLIN